MFSFIFLNRVIFGDVFSVRVRVRSEIGICVMIGVLVRFGVKVSIGVGWSLGYSWIWR